MSGQKLVLATRRMGGPLTMTGYAGDAAARQLMVAAFHEADREVARIEDLLTDYRPSPLNDINAGAGRHPVKVTAELFDLIVKALAVARESLGVFDITYAAVGILWRASRLSGVAPDPAQLHEAQQLVNYRNMALNYEESTVFLPKAGMRIGLGGVGKGYAVDRAYQLIRERGVVNFMVNGAGDMRAHSTEDARRPWHVAIQNPFSAGKDAAAGALLVKTGAIATSGDYQRYIMHGGVRCHHVLDARSGAIRQDVASVTIGAPSALVADMYATTVMASGVEGGMEFLRQRRGIRGVMIDRCGGVHTSC